MAKPKINPIEKVSQITPQYIKDSIAAHYPAEVSSKVSDLFAHTLAFDYKQKAKNLKWLFGDNTSITIDADPEKVLKSLKANGAYGIQNILQFLDAQDATYTAEQLSEKKCTYQKQVMRVSRVIEMASKNADIIANILSGNHLQFSTIGSTTYSDVFSYNIRKLSFTERASINTRMEGNALKTDGTCVIYKNSLDMYEVYGRDEVTVTPRGGIMDIDVNRALNQIKAGSVVVSMDLNDMITCSSGGVSSCMGFSGSYHNGWMNTFRADFGLIVFLKNEDDRFYKLGRQWLYARFTKDGQVFRSPALKFQRQYGGINNQHGELVRNFIFEKAEKAFGKEFALKNFDRITSGGLSPKETSLNVSGSPRAGYLDSGFDDGAVGFAMKENTLFKGQRCAFPAYQSCSYPNSGASVIFDFPDALALDGHPSHNGGFQGQTRRRTENMLGVIPPYKFVECSVTGNQVLDSECTFIPNQDGAGGTYITTSLLVKAFDPKLLPQEEEVEEVPEAVAVAEEPLIELSDEDLEDF